MIELIIACLLATAFVGNDAGYESGYEEGYEKGLEVAINELHPKVIEMNEIKSK